MPTTIEQPSANTSIDEGLLDLRSAVKALRKHKGLSQTKFGQAIGGGVTLPTIARWEAGTSRPHPGSLATLYRMARESERDDLAGVFFRGGEPPAERGPGAAEAIPVLVDHMIDAQMKISAARSSKSLSDQAKSDLLYDALQDLTQGVDFAKDVMKELSH